MPEMLPASHLGLYRAGLTGSLHRRSITVGRSTLVQDALETLRRGIGRKPKHHFLFIGPRGIGKTHLLSLLEDEVHENSDLSGAYHVVRFPEESNRLLSFGDFLLILCEILRDTLPGEPRWAELHERLATEERDELIVDTLVPAIRQRRRDRQQCLIIMLENLNQVFEQQLRDSRHVAALRGFFMEDNGCLLIATAPLHFGGISDHQQPFYDFFDVQLLDQLSEEETLELIRRNLQWEQRHDLLNDLEELQPKLRALYRMTGGSPRLSLMLYELIAHDAVTEVKTQFQILLDRITPFYQDRMRDLGPQERAVLETMATMRDQEKTPTAIAARMRMKPAQASVILARLVKSHYLKSMESRRDKRSRLYAIREGFFDIWLAMNLNRSARQRMPFLVEFFAEFYPSLEARNRKRDEYRRRLEAGEFQAVGAIHARADLIEGLDYLSEVGDQEERAAEKLRLARLHALEGNAPTAEHYLEEVRTLPLEGMGQWIVANSGGAMEEDFLADIEELVHCWEAFRTGNLEAFAERLKATGAQLSYRSWSETKVSFLREHLALLPDPRDRVKTRLDLGNLLRTLARWQEAEEELRTALTEAGTLDDDALRVWALGSLSRLLHETSRLAEAETLARSALRIAEQCLGPQHSTVATCLCNVAILLMAMNRMDEAEPLLRRALSIAESEPAAETIAVANCLNNLAALFQETNRVAEAEPLLRRSLALAEQTVGLHAPEVSTHLSNLACLLAETNRSTEAEPLLRRALAIDEQNFGPEHPMVAKKLHNLAQLLQKRGRPSEAEPLMRRSLAIAEQRHEPFHPEVALVLNSLAALLRNTNRVTEAETLVRRALGILLRSRTTNGQAHRYLTDVLCNYYLVTQTMGLSGARFKEVIVTMAQETQFPLEVLQRIGEGMLRATMGR